jgi:hypothetical protein
MSEYCNKLLKLTQLRQKNTLLLMETLKESDGVIGEIVRVHLVTEFLLEQLIGLVFNENTEHILSVGLKYTQKLDLASRLELVGSFNLIPDHVKGSLKKLNRLRNRAAHRLNEPITNEEIKELFIGLEGELPYHNVMEAGQIVALQRYLAFIFGSMLPKFELIENET